MNFQEQLQKYKELIDKELEVFIDEKISKINDKNLVSHYEIMKKFLLIGGKRLRPISLLMAFRGFNDHDDIIIRKSLSVELIHNSTLVHDDIMDEDELRRGKPTVFSEIKNKFLSKYSDKDYDGVLFSKVSNRFAVSNAILDGNILLTFGYECLESEKEAIRILNESYKTVVEGQIMDIMTEFETVNEEKYIGMISFKTADLFKSSIEIGALLGGANDEQIAFLREYAINAAIAFQIKDDIMDITKDSKKGHELGSDIKQGKKNILIIKALEFSSKKEMIRDVLGDEKATSEDVEKVIDEIKDCGALSYAEKLAESRIEKAKESLRKVSMKKESEEFFMNLAEFMVKREV